MHRFAKWYNPQGLNAVESEKEWQAREIKLANHLQGCGYALLTVIPVIGGIARCLLQCHFKEESRVFIAPPPIPAVVAAAHAPQLIPGAGDAIEVPPLLTPHQLEGLTPQERINAYGSAVGAYDELIQYHPHTVTAAQAAFYAAKTCDMACADRT